MPKKILPFQTEPEPLRAIELFCGIGGFRKACDKIGLQTVWANDLSIESSDTYKRVFGDVNVHQGDIRELKDSIPCHDLLTGGFPCQPFSSAGKKQGTRDPRGTLFAEIVSVIRDKLPSFFVLENVKRLLSMESGEHFGTILDAFSQLPYVIEWRVLKAPYFGLPQNRQRIFITGTRIKSENEISLKLVKEADLHDILRGERHVLENRALWAPVTAHGSSFPDWGVAYGGSFFARRVELFSAAIPCPTLQSILEKDPSEEFFMDESTLARIEKSEYVNRYFDGVQILYNQGGGARMGYSIFGVEGIAPTLTASHSRHYERYMIGKRFRRLTNIEYARLQGFPDQHCRGVSVFNQYGLYGNAVPPPMAKWAVNQIVHSVGITLGNLPHVANSQIALAI